MRDLRVHSLLGFPWSKAAIKLEGLLDSLSGHDLNAFVVQHANGTCGALCRLLRGEGADAAEHANVALQLEDLHRRDGQS